MCAYLRFLTGFQVEKQAYFCRDNLKQQDYEEIFDGGGCAPYAFLQLPEWNGKQSLYKTPPACGHPLNDLRFAACK